jgi:tRNA nucleotidyltransferase (CCA-adding enzyme)
MEKKLIKLEPSTYNIVGVLELIKLEPPIYNIVNILNRLGHQCLVVGGAVRDSILGIEPKDIDIEVYKISYEDLMTFLSKYGTVDLVGKKFGVIVFNPKNGKMKYDFSIPRKENKVGIGHTEFEITFDEKMTIKDAATRRDITINALAYDPIENHIYDYFGGVEDLKNKIIRHTSNAFSEDYLRILRIFQMQSRFDFEVHPDTIALMKKMLTDNPDEFKQLSVERVHEEFLKYAEKGVRHDLIFKFMRDTGLIEYYPELKALKETPQDPIWHPEGNTEIHSCLCLQQIDKIIHRENITGIEKTILVLSVLYHDIAKPNTYAEQEKDGRMAITNYGHEAMGGEMVKQILSKIGFNESLIIPISNLISNHLSGVSISKITSESGKIKAVKKLSRRLHPASIQQLLWLMEADSNGRGKEGVIPTGSEDIKRIASEITITNKQYEYLLMGRHLIEWFGMKPSAKFGIILKASYEAQEEGLIIDLESGKKWLKDNLELLTK